MGEAKEAVKGSGPPAKQKSADKKARSNSNIITRLDEVLDDLADAIEVKAGDCAKEGRKELAENMVKLGILRSASTMIRTVKQMLEEY